MIKVYLNSTDILSRNLKKANHTERVGRKATGLRPINGYGGRVARRIQHLPVLDFARLQLMRRCFSHVVI